jgi:hypothetical protein
VEHLQIDADLPDLVDKDNIENDPLCKHAHSHKMKMQDGKLVRVDGSALERVVGLCQDAHDFHQEGKQDLVRYCLAKMTHYAIDGTSTFPHQHQGKPWSLHHAKFEDELGKYVIKHRDLIQDAIKDMEFTPYKDVLEGCTKHAMAAWPIGEEVVQKYEDRVHLTDDEMLDIVKICVQAVGDLWVTVAKEGVTSIGKSNTNTLRGS